MPPQIEKKEDAKNEFSSTSSINYISLDDAKQLANEAASRAASEAANRAIESYKKPTAFDDDVNIDKQIRATFLKKMSAPSLGEMLASKIDGAMTDQLVSKLVPGLFGGSNNDGGMRGKEKGVMGAILDILDTKFAYGLGESLGNQAPAIIKSLGANRVGAIIDNYNKSVNPNSNVSDAEIVDESQKATEKQKIDDIIMTLDSTNPEHVNQFMSATGVKKFADAQRIIIAEQDRIRKERGINTEQSQPLSEKPKPDNIRNPQENPRGMFFDNGMKSQESQSMERTSKVPFSGEYASTGQLNEEEFMRTINPDDPLSQQQYLTFKGYSGNIPLDEVKRLIIRDKKKYENKNIMEQVISKDKDNADSNWSDNDLNKPVSIQSSKEMKVNEPLEQPSDRMMNILEKLDKKIDYLEHEIIKLKDQKIGEVKDEVKNEVKDKVKDEVKDVIPEIVPEIVSEVIIQNVSKNDSSDDTKKEGIEHKEFEPPTHEIQRKKYVIKPKIIQENTN